MKVFISYAKEDSRTARQLSEDLRRAGFSPWLDTEALVPGQRWPIAIETAIRESSRFIALLSKNSVSKRGHVQAEVLLALEILHQTPESREYIIPVRLDDCQPQPAELLKLHWVDLFPDYGAGLSKILAALGYKEGVDLGGTAGGVVDRASGADRAVAVVPAEGRAGGAGERAPAQELPPTPERGREINLTRSSLVISLVACFWITLSVAAIMLSSLQPIVAAPRTLPTHIPPNLISELRFSPSGALIATVESGGTFGGPFVDIYTWDSTYEPADPAKVTLDFGQLIGKVDNPPRLIPAFATASWPAEPSSSTQSPPVLPYALSEDGSMIAWSWNGVLFAGPFGEPKKIRIALGSSAPVGALAFFGPDVVGMLHSGGEFRLERLSRRDPSLPGTNVLGAWRISGRGPFRVLSNFQSGQGILVTPAPFFQSFPANTAGTFITVSEKGKVALGTVDGKIQFPQPQGPYGEVELPEARPVRTMAFVDEDRVIASASGGRLYLVEEGEPPAVSLSSAPRGIRLLDLDAESLRIAMVTPRSIVTAELRKRVVLGERQAFMGVGSFFVSLLIVLSRVIFADWYKLRVLQLWGSDRSD